MAVDFLKPLGRDAYAVVRGFLYQVAVTIGQWLNLGANEALELECGEDIDIVHQANDEEALERFLQQVKYRASQFSLNSPFALQSVVNFYYHVKNNPSVQVRFRYITNSHPVKERKASAEQDLPGVLIWERLRQGVASDIRKELNIVRDLLRNTSKPGKIPKVEWSEFQRFIAAATDDGLLTFIASFEWAYESGSLDEISKQVKKKLGVLYAGNSDALSSVLFNHLINHVFGKLAQIGGKTLTASELTLELSVASRQGQEAVLSGLAAIGHRLERAAARLEIATGKAETSALSAFGIAYGINTQIKGGFPDEILTRPVLVDKCVKRAETVGVFEKSLSSVTWLALFGQAGFGKTQLALLVSERFPKTIWVNLRNIHSSDQSLAIAQALFAESSLRPPWPPQNVVETVVSLLPIDTILVLDDLSVNDPGSSVFSGLLRIAMACFPAGVKILSTSTSRLPQQIADHLGNRFGEAAVPGFSDAELKELLLANGAPDAVVTSGFISFAEAITHRHPQIVSAFVRHLKNHGWHLETAVFGELLDGTFANDLKLQTQRLLQQTLPQDARELLYRLNVIGPHFFYGDALRIAEISPPINAAAEKIAQIHGIWIQPLTSNSFAISPLVRHLGAENLSTQTRQKMHEFAADLVLAKKTLTLYDCLSAITHLVGSDNYNPAAVVYMTALHSLIHGEGVLDPTPLTFVWFRKELPERIDLDLRIFLRGFQIAFAIKYAQDWTFLLADLKDLLGKAGAEQALGTFSGCGTAAIELGRHAPLEACALLTRAIFAEKDLRPEVRDYLNGYPELTDGFWMFGSGLNDPRDFAVWFDFLEKLPEPDLEKFRTSAFGAYSVWTLSGAIWSQHEGATQATWQNFLGELLGLENRAMRLKSRELWMCFVRTRINILLIGLKDFTSAAQLAQETYNAVLDNPMLSFVVAAGFGVGCADVQQWQAAELWLNRAVTTGDEHYPSFYLMALLWLGWARSVLKRSCLSDFARAVEFSQGSPEISELEVIKTLGEYSISLWTERRHSQAFEIWDEAVERVLAHRGECPEWKQVVALMGNNTLYFSRISRHEPAPDNTNVSVPEQGMFLRKWPDLSDKATPELRWFLPAAMTWFSEGVQRYDAVSKWASRTVEIAGSVSNATSGRFFLLYSIPRAITEGRYIDAIDYARESSRIAQSARREDLSQQSNEPKLETARDRESQIVHLSVVPAFWHLLCQHDIYRSAVRNSAEGLIEKCRSTAGDAAWREIWDTVADTIAAVFSESPSCDQLIAIGNNLVKETPAVTLIAFFGASLICSPERGLAVQWASIEYVEKYYLHLPAFSEQVVAPFVNQFWCERLISEGHLFYAPSKSLDLLRGAPSEFKQSLRHTFKIISEALRFPLSEAQRTWLAS